MSDSPSTTSTHKCKTGKCPNRVPARGHKYCYQCRRLRAAKARKHRAGGGRIPHLAHSFNLGGPSNGPAVQFSSTTASVAAPVGVNASFYESSPLSTNAMSGEETGVWS